MKKVKLKTVRTRDVPPPSVHDVFIRIFLEVYYYKFLVYGVVDCNSLNPVVVAPHRSGHFGSTSIVLPTSAIITNLYHPPISRISRVPV